MNNKLISNIGIALMLLPGSAFILYSIFSSIRADSIFYVLYLFAPSIIVFSIGLILLIVGKVKNDKSFKKFGLIVAAYILLFPLSILIENCKLKIFIFKNESALNSIASNILGKKITIAEAENFIKNKGLLIEPMDVLESEGIVLFLTNGIIDNCNGIAFSKFGNEPRKNSCGTLVTWKKVNKNWYQWGTI
jgi:hypothetical protein